MSPSFLSKARYFIITLLLINIVPVLSHSWVDELTVIDRNGTFVGKPGYIRGFIPRDSPAFNDSEMDWLLPPNGEVNHLNAGMFLCRPSQRTRKQQSSGYGRLQVGPGSFVALRYQENGHVTQPQIPPGKPAGSGIVYVYGTSNPKDDEKILKVHGKWNAAGSGGDKRGKLLTARNFDDGRCYQINDSPISKTRQKKFAHALDPLMGDNMWCQIDLAIPKDIDGTYTLYWVWDWSTQQTAVSESKLEFYTSCMDVSVKDRFQEHDAKSTGYIEGQDLNFAAIPAYIDDLDAAAASVRPAPTSPSVATPSPTQSPTTQLSSNTYKSVDIPPPFTIEFGKADPVATSSVDSAIPTIRLCKNKYNSNSVRARQGNFMDSHHYRHLRSRHR